ncbi:MAG: hypothetical protein LQ347_006484 [Umbilicaria vellea]|nr:MAG: hypothetical protein LQ347_006484 [Umbilicaria vellea]
MSDHPSVRNSHSPGAIGVMGVKKTVDGLWLHFAHNTDSFAVASMHSDEKVPVLVMSRSKGNGSIAAGGRSMKYRRPGWGRSNADTWPADPDDTLDQGPSEQSAKRQKTKAEKPPRRPSLSTQKVIGGGMSAMPIGMMSTKG